MAKLFICLVFLAFLYNFSEGFRINQKDLRLALDLARDLESLEKRQDISVDIGSEDTNTHGETSMTDTAPADPSEIETPVGDKSEIEIPTGDISGTNNALADSSGTDISVGDTSGTETSAADTPATDTSTVITSATDSTGTTQNTITEDANFQKAFEDLKQKVRDGREGLSNLLTSLRGHIEDMLKKIQDTLDSTEDIMRNLLNEAADVADDKLINQLAMDRKMAALKAARKKAAEAVRKNAMKAAKKAAARKKAAEAAVKAAEEQEENKGNKNKAKVYNKWQKGRHHGNLFGLLNNGAMNKFASNFLKKFSTFVNSRENN